MTKISATIVADSLTPNGHRLTTMELLMPRIILAELNTHRLFSRNSASSRAIPFKRIIQMIRTEPFTPVAFQKDHSGMQGFEYFEDETEITIRRNAWNDMRWRAADEAEAFAELGVTKQLSNRALEAYMWTRVLVSATEWDNFFWLRCPRYVTPYGTFYSRRDAAEAGADSIGGEPTDIPSHDDILGWLKLNRSGAEIHMSLLAEAMWDAFNDSKPKELLPGEWHIPYDPGYKVAADHVTDNGNTSYMVEPAEEILKTRLQIATARQARTSYTTVDQAGKEITTAAELVTYNKLITRPYTAPDGSQFLTDDPIHSSPTEHSARVMSADQYVNFSRIQPIIESHPMSTDRFNRYEMDKTCSVLKAPGYDLGIEHGWCRNFRGLVQLRHIIENGEQW